ncbi:MAG: CsgG/HfaB family protein [bacterium]
MKNILHYGSLIAVFGLCSCSTSQSTSRFPYSSVKEGLANIGSIAVLPFTDSPNAEGGFSGRVVAGAVVERIVNVERWKVIERDRILDVVKEMQLNALDFTDKQIASEVGRKVGADAVIVGAVSEYRTTDLPVFLGILSISFDEYKVGCNLRVVRVKDQTIVFAGSCRGRSRDSYEEACRDALKPLLDNLAMQVK